MVQPKTAAQSLYPHLPSAARPEVKQRQNSLGDAMWPSLSREAKQQEYWREWAREEQKAHNKRMAEHLRQINERLAKEREG